MFGLALRSGVADLALDLALPAEHDEPAVYPETHHLFALGGNHLGRRHFVGLRVADVDEVQEVIELGRLGRRDLDAPVAGVLALAPLRMDVPGGIVQVELDYLPTEENITVNLNADIDKFDIGVLVRRIKPEANMGGMIYLNTSLHSTASDFSTIMENAEGHFDFGLVPQNFSAGVIDMWAVNLISSIMTEVSEEEQSEVNCVVVRFGIEDGLMEEKAIYMDTSNMRVAGKAKIDLKTGELNILLVPKAKKPEFFSLAVPIKVDGKLDDFGMGIGVGRLTGAIFSFITSPVHVPIRKIFTDKIPKDGREACRQAWALTGEGDGKSVQ